MDKGFEVWAAHTRPNQIWVPHPGSKFASKIETIDIWVGYFFWKNGYVWAYFLIFSSTSLPTPNLSIPPTPSTIWEPRIGRCHSVYHLTFKSKPSQFKWRHVIKGALDKYNIYLFISNSIEDFKLNQYRNFQLILSMRFHFTRYFVNSIISRVSHRLLYCVFIEVDFEK